MRLSYSHPVFNREAVAAQARWSEISGRRGTHYAGAWWGYGFHEDGVRSALAVAERFGVGFEDMVARIERHVKIDEEERLAS
jgi:predicted NAD/FAD-binding protein